MTARRLMVRLGQIAAVLGCAALAHAQAVSAPKVPDAIKAPPGEQVVLETHAKGSQIYICSQTDGKSQWTLKAPDAQLRNAKGALVIHHFAGPSWKHKDGSEVTGKAVQKVASPDPNSIPWLLVSVVSHTGNGMLEHVTSIQRINTHGGQPPAGECDAAKQTDEVKIPYTADYYFYAPASVGN